MWWAVELTHMGDEMDGGDYKTYHMVNTDEDTLDMLVKNAKGGVKEMHCIKAQPEQVAEQILKQGQRRNPMVKGG